jgi:arabinofuranosyltransferase
VPDAAEIRPARWLDRAFPLLCGLLFTGLWLSYRDFWLDDAFITFRYARNVASGLGPVFNPGEAVEGYTSFLWMGICSAFFALGDDALALGLIKISGLLTGLWILWRTWTFPEPGPEPSGPVRRYAVVLLAANPVFVANCGDGMETPLYTALLLECARSFARTPSARSGAVTGALVAAAAWTRPESIGLWLGLPLLLWLCRRRARLRPWFAGFAAASLPLILGHLLWRWHYYGALVPNTFYAKATGALLPRLASGLHDVTLLGSPHLGVPPLGLWLALALACAGLVALRRHATPDVFAWHAALWAMVGFRLAFDVWSGSEFMGVFRFLVPALPPLFVLADQGLRVFSPHSVRRRNVAAGLCALAVAVGSWGHVAQAQVRAGYERGLREAHVALGSWLAARHPETALVALGDAGATPFYSGLRVIDLWGLADATIARLPGEYGSRIGAADYALGRNPDVIVLWSVAPILRDDTEPRVVGAQHFDRAIARHPRFRRDYRFVRTFTFRPRRRRVPGYYLAVFERLPEAVDPSR